MTLTMQFNHYTLDQEIGRDNLATVYKGYRTDNQQPAAIRVIGPQFTFDPQFQQQFRQMVEQNLKLEHPNIIRTYGMGHEEERLFLVQELIEGQSLAEVLDSDGAFSPKRMFKIARQIAAALDYAHQQEQIHGDLTAHCIYIGSNDHVMVTDFGHLEMLSDTSLGKQGHALGSPETMAPERVQGVLPNQQTDLYALGMLSYQMLTAQLPFEGSLAAVLHAQAYDMPPPVHLINPSIPIEISQAIEKMLAKQPIIRYQTGADFMADLSKAIVNTTSQSLPILKARPSEPQAAIPASAHHTRSHKPTASAATTRAVPRTRTSRKYVWIGGAMAAIILSLIFSSSLGAVSLWQISHISDTSTPTRPAIVLDTPSPAPSGKATSTVASIITLTNRPAASTALPPIDLPTPGAPTINPDSPFTNLRLAQKITANNQPAEVSRTFPPGDQPLYLFFDYTQVGAGKTWSHRWTWADTELATYQTVWPANYNPAGTAWIFYSPPGGFRPGPYKVTLAIESQTVATATFVINR